MNRTLNLQSSLIFAAVTTVVLAARAAIALGQVPVTLLPGLTAASVCKQSAYSNSVPAGY